MTRSWNIRGIYGNDFSVSETIEGTNLILSIQQNDEKGRIATVVINEEQWRDLCDLKYKPKFAEPPAETVPLPPPRQPGTTEEVAF